MTRLDADLERTVRAWLQDGENTMPDRVFDAVVARMPATRQRRYGWWPADRAATRLLGAAAAVLVLAVTLIGLLLGTNVGDDDRDTTWRGLPTVAESQLAAGDYLIGEPFPVRVGITVPGGWTAGPLRGTEAQISGDDGVSLTFTLVEGVYADPCHNDLGLIDPPVGPTADDLAAALAELPGITVSGPSDTTIDGHRAVQLTLTAPAAFEGCTAEPQSMLFKIWGVPEGHALDPGARNRLWIVQVGETRLVISTLESEGASPPQLAELNAVVASIDLDPVVENLIAPSEEPAPVIRPLPTSGVLEPGTYDFEIQLHRHAGAVPIPLADRHRVQLDAPDGWTPVGNGIERPLGGGADLGISAWAIGRIYADPCRWQAEEPGIVDPSELATLDGLAGAHSRWWNVSPATPGVDPAADAPAATEPMNVARFARLGRYIELTIPDGVDVEACDAGEYRLWEDSSGRPRSAHGPGERIQLHVIDAEPGLLVMDVWELPAAPPDAAETLEALVYSVWLHDPAPASDGE